MFSDQELDEGTMINNIKSTDYFKYNQQLKETMLDEGNTINTTSTTLPTLPIVDHYHDDHVMEIVEEEDFQKNEFLGNMNLSSWDTFIWKSSIFWYWILNSSYV